MHITFGMRLDAGAWPDELGASSGSFGALTLGPRGLLSLLETHLGLPPLGLGRAVRAAALARAAAGLATRRPQPFYARSFAVDSVGVAELLLDARDELLLAGGRSSGTAAPPARALPRRVADVAALEAPFREGCARHHPLGGHGGGLPDRLAAVLAELALDPPPELPIAKLLCVTPPELLAGQWRALLERLGALGVAIGWRARPEPAAPADTDLGRLQRALAAGDQGPAAELRGDGTLCLLRAPTPGEEAELVAAVVARALERAAPAGAPSPGAGGPAGVQGELWPSGPRPAPRAAGTSTPRREPPVVLVAPGSLHDTALRAAGLPVTGARRGSSQRPALSVLPLALAMLRAPLDPELLVSFCDLEVSPLWPRTRELLRKTVLEHPGRGGPAWHAAIERALAPLMPEAARRERERIAAWLEQPTAPRGEPLGVVRVLEVVARVTDWLDRTLDARARATRPADDDEGAALDRQLEDALRAATELRIVLDGRDTIEPAELDALLDGILAESRAVELAPAEAGPIAAVRHPAQLLGEVDTLVWCAFVADAWPTPPPSRWSRTEREALGRHGLHLPDPDAEADHAWTEALDALLAARGRVVLTGHGLDDESLHPVWHALAARCTRPTLDRIVADGTPDGLARSFPGTWLVPEVPGAALPADTADTADEPGAHRALDWRRASGPEGHAGGARTARSGGRAAAAQPPRAPRRTWRVAPELAGRRREVESHNSLSRLAACPLQWLLTYQVVPGGALDAARASPRAGPSRQLDRATPPGLRSGALLEGILAHRVVEEVFGDWRGDVDPQRLGARAERVLHELLPTEAAHLLLPGAESTREQLAYRLRRGLTALAAHLAAAGVERVETELDARVDDARLGPVQGRVDLVAHRAGSRIVIDVKWGGARRLDELRKGEATQLALYRRLVAGTDGKTAPGAGAPLLNAEVDAPGSGAGGAPASGADVAAVGYFLVTQQRLLTLGPPIFPGVQPIDGPAPGETLERLTASVQAARDALAEGVVVATCIDDGEMCGGAEVAGGLAVAPVGEVSRYCALTTFCGLRRQKPRRRDPRR